MTTLYAWSRILVGNEGSKQIIIRPGEKVTKEDLKSDDEHWNALIEGGAIRPTPWPEDLNPDNPNQLSPNEHRLRKLRLQREELELEMAGVGGSASVLTETDLELSDKNYEVDEKGNLKEDAAGNPIRKIEDLR